MLKKKIRGRSCVSLLTQFSDVLKADLPFFFFFLMIERRHRFNVIRRDVIARRLSPAFHIDNKSNKKKKTKTYLLGVRRRSKTAKGAIKRPSEGESKRIKSRRLAWSGEAQPGMEPARPYMT